MFKLRDFLLRHHGKINRILISYSTTNSPSSNQKEYEKWYNETNKDFIIDMDLQHTPQKIEEFNQLLPYLDLEISCWDLFEKRNEFILEVTLK